MKLAMTMTMTMMMTMTMNMAMTMRMTMKMRMMIGEYGKRNFYLNVFLCSVDTRADLFTAGAVKANEIFHFAPQLLVIGIVLSLGRLGFKAAAEKR